MTVDVNPGEAVLETAPSSPNPILTPPRAAWIEFLLHFSTFGLYTSYWLVRRMQEFKRIYATDSRPWLWFFVPLVVIAQLFALPKFVGFVTRFERESGVPEWNAWHGAWYVLVILLTICFNISDKYEFPWWFFPAGMLLWASLFTVIYCRINTAKKHQTIYEFSTRRYPVAIPEIIILLVMLPVSLFICFLFAKDKFIDNTLEKFKPGVVYLNDQHQFKLPIKSGEWRSVKLGTHSNGEAELELQGPLSEMYFIVFKHEVDETLNNIAYARQNEIMDETPSSQCKQIRVLSAERNSVIAKVTCRSSALNNPVLETVTVIETSTGIIEMYGYMSSVKGTFNDHKVDFEKMASGLEPL